MVVWLCGKETPTVASHIWDKEDIGPYVHLDQFLEEVERRARLKTWPHLDYDDDLTWEVLQELDKEIKEQK